MVSDLVNAILAYGHIVSAMAWFGGLLISTVVISPTMRGLSPAASGEVQSKLVLRMSRYLITVAVLTLLFGVLLAIGKTNGDINFSLLMTSWGQRIATGAILGFAELAWSLAERPSFMKMMKLGAEAKADPNPETLGRLKILQRRFGIHLVLGLVILGTVVALMVAAARL